MNQAGQAFAALGVICIVGAAVGFGWQWKRERDAEIAVERDRILADAEAARRRAEEPLPPAPPPKPVHIPTLFEALAEAKPSAETEDELDDGAKLFTRWAVHFMRWDDVAIGMNESTFARVMKDPKLDQGRRLCVRGKVVEIFAKPVDQKKAHVGVIATVADEPVYFVAVGDTGDLVANSDAVFCGVTIGAFSYSSEIRRVRSMLLVGMFGLPPNVATARPKPSGSPSAAHPR